MSQVQFIACDLFYFFTNYFSSTRVGGKRYRQRASKRRGGYRLSAPNAPSGMNSTCCSHLGTHAIPQNQSQRARRTINNYKPDLIFGPRSQIGSQLPERERCANLGGLAGSHSVEVDPMTRVCHSAGKDRRTRAFMCPKTAAILTRIYSKTNADMRSFGMSHPTLRTTHSDN